MKTLLWLLSAVLSLQCGAAQITLGVSGPGTVKPTETLEMTCKVSGASLTDRNNMYCVNWVRQPDGKGLEWLGRICFDNGKAYGQSVQGRLNITRDTNKGEVYAKLTGVKPEESGTYYCARVMRYNGWDFDLWSDGQPIIVTSVTVFKPQVFPLVAFLENPGTTTTLGCLTYYFPPPVSSKIETSSGKQLLGVREFKGSLSGDSPALSLLSLTTLSKSDWEANTYKCHVQHNSIDIVKTIINTCDVQPQEPSVHLWQGTCPESSNGQIELTCQVYNLTSTKAKLQWFINGQEQTLSEYQNDLGKTQSLFYVKSSTVTISKAKWNNGVQVKCRATDLTTGKSAEDTIRKCSENFNCLGINVFIVPPTIEDLYLHKIARIRCVASNLKDLDGSSSFEWSFPGSSTPLNQQTEDPQAHENGTFSVSNVLTVSPDIWKKNIEFTCVYRNYNLQNPIITRIKKGEVTTASQPVLLLIPPSEPEKTKNEMCSVVAMVSSFWPNNIYVGWTTNNMEVPKDQYINSEPMLDTRKTWIIYSKLSIPCSDWESGSVYSCVVGHESIPMNFIRNTIDKYSGKPTSVNMSVTVSDTTLSCY